jgi:hypothetical protein
MTGATCNTTKVDHAVLLVAHGHDTKTGAQTSIGLEDTQRERGINFRPRRCPVVQTIITRAIVVCWSQVWTTGQSKIAGKPLSMI